MKFQNCILINFVTDALRDGCTHGRAESNMPLQLFQSWGHKQLTYATVIKSKMLGYITSNCHFFQLLVRHQNHILFQEIDYRQAFSVK